MKKSLLILLVALSLTACRHGSLPDGVMDEERMADFLADAYLVESFYAIETQYRYDVLTETALRNYDSILALHSLTREQVERSFEYYSQHPELYQRIQDSAAVRLEARRDKLPAAPAAVPVPGPDSIRRTIPRLLLDR